MLQKHMSSHISCLLQNQCTLNSHLQREGKIIASTSFTTSTSIADPYISVYDIEIQGDSNLDSAPTSKLEARKMTGNSPDTQKGKTLA